MEDPLWLKIFYVIGGLLLVWFFWAVFTGQINSGLHQKSCPSGYVRIKSSSTCCPADHSYYVGGAC